MSVLAEKAGLCPEACRKLVRGEEMIGYALAHPWRLFDIPRLDSYLLALPPDPDCLYLHDIAVLPEGRGSGAAGRYVDHLRATARSRGLASLACVSVYGTSRLWRAFGFEIIVDPRLEAALRGYDESATYMVARVEESP
ncbi:GNAT family N-acetyltransferase [Enterovirga rhinocerotis]|uniref:GNAT family N-acetyltransferase n=1 Tax=Enterovirga rhinocerotis TaxID=1339210 RepID=UPI00315DE492